MYWILVIGAAALPLLLYFYVVKPLKYWSRKGVQQKTIFEQFSDIAVSLLQLKPQADLIKESYDRFPNARYNGFYQLQIPVLWIRDPELIRQIAVKDFDHFTDHNLFIPEDIEPLWGKNLFALKGDKWRDMRATLSPSFTSSKMKSMFVLMNECSQQFVDYFKKGKSSQIVEMKDTFTRFGNDVIASTAFGIKCDSLTDRNNEFYLMGKSATNFRGFWFNIKMFTIFLFPTFSKLLGFRLFPRKVSSFFRRLVKTNMESRETSGVVRPDMIHLLMEAKKGRLKHEEHTDVVDSGFAVIEESTVGRDKLRQKQRLSDDDVTAQALIFFFAGFDSVSTLMCFLIYEIVVNPEIQTALRNEVNETLENCGGTLTYEALLKMKYMDMVVSETLRKWPIQIIVDRICTKPYTIYPEREGELPVHIKKDDYIWFPVYGIQRDPQFYPNPDKFDPERFSDENRSNINSYTYLSFGAGPRSCIGNRFALLETKTILFNILSSFEINVTEKTTVPVKLAKDIFTPTAENGFWFELKPINIS